MADISGLTKLHYFFFGISAFQLIYIAYHYLLFKRIEFLYFLLYIAGMLIYIFLRSSSDEYENLMNHSHTGERGYHAFILVFCSSFMYAFLRHLIDAPKKHLQFNRILKPTEWIIRIFTVVILSIAYLTKDTRLIPISVKVFYVLSTPFQIYIIYYCLKNRTITTNLVLIGILLLMFFLRITFSRQLFTGESEAETMAQYSVMLGLTLFFFFLDLSLIYRSKEIQQEKLNWEIQKLGELNRQRALISNDLHDDAGASLSSLYLYSTIAENAVERDKSLAREHIQRISKGIRDVMDNMNDIIWAVSRDDHNTKLFSSRIKDFYHEIFDHAGITTHYEIDDETEKQLKDMTIRRNLMLITKEAINNSMKHSSATEIVIRLGTVGEYVELFIKDNGQGIPAEIPTRGHGLDNMKQRSENMGGNLDIVSNPQQGTMVLCRVPITRISD